MIQDPIVDLTGTLIEKLKESDRLGGYPETSDEVIEERNEILKDVSNQNTMINAFKQTMNRETVLEEINFEENTESLSDAEFNDEEDCGEDKTMSDTEEIDETMPYNEEDDSLSYLPCGAHNIQLVIKDGLRLDQKNKWDSFQMQKIGSSIRRIKKLKQKIA